MSDETDLEKMVDEAHREAILEDILELSRLLAQ